MDVPAVNGLTSCAKLGTRAVKMGTTTVNLGTKCANLGTKREKRKKCVFPLHYLRE
jgi:hypothetical protein